MLIATAYFLERIGLDGTVRWAQPGRKADMRGLMHGLNVSADGTVVDFVYRERELARARFYIANPSLILNSDDDGRTFPPVREGLPVEDWLEWWEPWSEGKPLLLDEMEQARSEAVRRWSPLCRGRGLDIARIRR